MGYRKLLLSLAVVLLVCGSAVQVAAHPAPTVSLTAYAHPEILVDAQWVAENLNDPTVRIIDARLPFEGSLYSAGHIPGAVFVNVFSDLCCPSKIMEAEPFAQLMSNLGIGDNTTVVIYDTSGGIWGARLWWALMYYGHTNVKMLNGGLLAWIMAGQPLETAVPSVTPADFHAITQPQWIATMDEVRKAVKNKKVSIVDALPWPYYTGDLHQYARPGHIKSAVSFPAPDMIDGIWQTVLPPEDLSRMISRIGLDPGKRTITYCGGGYAGAHAAFVLYLMGFNKVGLYDGSLMEWASIPSNPMEVVKMEDEH